MTERPAGALSGYRVLDLTDSHGAYCTRLLADLGADVIKIEPPGGDPLRQAPPFAGGEPDPEKSLYFLYRNTNKRGVTLDLGTSAGKTAFQRLVKTADVLVDNLPPGRLADLGLDYPVLRDINPHLVMASISEFGPTGPYRDFKGSNLVACALSGILISSGFSERPCLMPGTPAYDAASLVAAIAILAALYHRGITGQGQYIHTSVHETARLALYPWPVPIHSYGINPGNPPPGPEPRMSASIYPMFPCKNGLIRVIAMTPRQWKSLLRVLGNPEPLLKPEFDDFLYRIFNPDRTIHHGGTG
jgi:crotonobetainyl-CoA:carnitine CoA-transferase CaiB-like acyl-CoA transferase